MKSILFFIILFVCDVLNAQTIDMKKILGIEQDIQRLDQYIDDNIQKDSRFNGFGKINKYHIFFLEFDSPDDYYLFKRDVKKSLYNLHTLYGNGYYCKPYVRNNEMIKTHTLLADSCGNFLGWFHRATLYNAPIEFCNDNLLAKMFYDGLIDFAFFSFVKDRNDSPYGINCMKYVLIKNDKLYFCDKGLSQLLITPIEDGTN